MPSPLEEAAPAELDELAQVIIDAARAQDAGWLPAKVLAWYPPGQVDGFTYPARVDLEIMVRYRRSLANAEDLLDGEELCPDTPDTGVEAVGSYPDVFNIPVVYPGARAARWRGPIAVGETGKLHPSGREILRWVRGEGKVTPPWMGGQLEGEFSSLASAVWTPGLDVGADETAQFSATEWTFGPPSGSPGQLRFNPTAGTWALDGTTIDLRAVATSIGAVGPGVALAKNAQVIAALNAFNATIQAAVGIFTPAQQILIANAVAAALVPLIGTTSLTAE